MKGKTMNIKFGRTLAAGLAIAIVALTLNVVASAEERKFYVQSGKEGCESIITERGEDECKKVQAEKDRACGIRVECDENKQQRQIEKYKEAKEQLDQGRVADSDKERLAKTVSDLKEDIEARKEAASKGVPIAEGCVTARENVQTWFMKTGIPLTESTRDEALQQRKELLEKLAESQKKQGEAKSARESKPDDSSAQREYDSATEEMRNAEQALAQFNEKYGKDIERNAERLIEHYQAENASHQAPLQELKNRAQSCKNIENMSY
jgi:hypothetical protein